MPSCALPLTASHDQSLAVGSWISLNSMRVSLPKASPPRPVDEYAQLKIVYSIFANHHMRGIQRAHAASVGARAVETHLESLDPDPFAPDYIERMVEARHLPRVGRWIVRCADVQAQRRRIEKPAF